MADDDDNLPDLKCYEIAEYAFETGPMSIGARMSYLDLMRTNEGKGLPSLQYRENAVLDANKRDSMIQQLIQKRDWLQVPTIQAFKGVVILDGYLAETRDVDVIAQKSHQFQFACLFLASEDSRTEYRLLYPNYKTLKDKAEVEEMKNRIYPTIKRYKSAKNTAFEAVCLMSPESVKDPLVELLLHLTLLDHGFLQFPPSLVATTVLHAAALLQPTTKAEEVTQVVSSGYKSLDVKNCSDLLYKLLLDNNRGSRIKTEYMRNASYGPEEYRKIFGDPTA